jgi:multisubunit Na+/H+ antiporter MnhB subunit
MIGLVLDLLIAVSLIGLAWRVLAARELFEAVVVFIVLGLLMAVAWARLSAPDIALAEAAVGAGLTGVLLLDTLRALRGGIDQDHQRCPQRSHGGAPATAAALVLGVLLIGALLQLPTGPAGLASRIAEVLPDTGVTHPVTAVLLNLRAYDTWLELGVLLVAVIAVLSLRGSAGLTAERAPDASAVLRLLVRCSVPAMVMVAGYLLWLGKSAAGGAFQAGAVLGAAGVLLWLAGHRGLPAEKLWRTILLLGFATFMTLGLGMMAAGGQFLEYPRERAAEWILLIETAAALSIGGTMTALFIALRSPPDHPGHSTHSSLEA